jgi:inosose dehydratase
MALADIVLATSPTTWGVDFADAPENPTPDDVLDDIERSPLGALELGPVGYLPEDPTLLRQALRSRNLTAVGSFLFESLHDPGCRDQVVTVARRACRAIRAAGGTVLVVIDRPGRERASTAGRSRVAHRLSRPRWLAFIDTVSAVCAIAETHNLSPAFHPHAGSYVEFADEIERLMSDTDISLCLDTGHAAYAGILAEEAIVKYASRLTHLHLKDVNQQVLDRVHEQPLGFWRAIEAGIFCPLGEGTVDIAKVASALRSTGYGGFATIEQDRVPGTGAPLEDLSRSLRVLAAAGIESPGTEVASEPRGATRNEGASR